MESMSDAEPAAGAAAADAWFVAARSFDQSDQELAVLVADF